MEKVLRTHFFPSLYTHESHVNNQRMDKSTRIDKVC